MAKKDNGLLLLLLLGGAVFAFSGKAKAKVPTKPLDEDDVDDPRGVVIPGEPTRVDTPQWPEGPPLLERPIDSALDAAKAAAAAADSLTRNPLYPSIPSDARDDEDALPAQQAPLDSVAPVAQPHGSPSAPGSQTPAGYDPAAARRGARALVNHLKRAGKANYDRRLLEAWQRQAGLVPDRIYGGSTRGALLHYGASDAPAPFFKPFDTVQFVPPEQR
jgi:hypothetical protein